MARIARLIVAVGSLSVLCACSGPGLYRSIGSIPGVAWDDYAFTFYCDTATQIYQFTPPQVESSMFEALVDLGFKDVEPPVRSDGECVIRAKAPDGRPVRITISARGAMAMVAVAIGPDHLGDYQLSRDLLRRVAFNLGSGMRTFLPADLTLPRRLNPPTLMPERTSPPPPEALQGEGLRPDEKQKEATATEEPTVPGLVVPPNMNVPGMTGGFVPTMSFPNPPWMPYAPWPYTPYGSGYGYGYDQ
jgi:hypothetical protein